MDEKEYNFMSDAQQKQSPNLLLNMAMVSLETVFTTILHHDRIIALQTKKFVDQKIVLKINSYLPFFDFYVQFTEHGILFDLEAPEKAVDLDIRTTLNDLIKIFILGNRRRIRTMRIEGDPILKDQFRDLAILFSLPKVIADWRQWLNEPVEDGDLLSSKKRITPLLEKLDEQRVKIDDLQVEVKQYKNRVRRLEQEKKRNTFIFSVISVLLITLLLYNIWV